MRNILWFLLPTVPLLDQVHALPSLKQAHHNVLLSRAEGGVGDFAAMDLAFIKKMAAIGDSYSAGIGAGKRLGNLFNSGRQSDYACSRYDRAFPYLVNNDPRLGDPKQRNFQFKSCSGAKTKEVLEKQIPSLDDGQQVILLSVGGNDANLVDILNQCVFQIAVVDKEQVAAGKIAAKTKEFKYFDKVDWDNLGRGCPGIIDLTTQLVRSDEFKGRLDKVLEAAKKKLAPGGKIYYTGYAKFWAPTMSRDCDKVTWTSWFYKSWNINLPAARLTWSNRAAMNQLVDYVNNQIRLAADRAGPSVAYIDYDGYIDMFEGRFCENGVDESSRESNKKRGRLFYKRDMLDPFGLTPYKRSTQEHADGTFTGDLNIYAQLTQILDPEVKFADPAVEDEKKKEQDAQAAALSDGLAGDIISSVLPDGYARVFHPTVFLHRIISNIIIFKMGLDNLQANGFAQVPKELIKAPDTCELKQPEKPRCLNQPLSAPKSTEDAGGVGDIGVQDAIKKWCKEQGGKRVSNWFVGERESPKDYSARFGITDFGVRNRYSFWLRATHDNVPKCNPTTEIIENECVSALSKGVDTCEAETNTPGRTTGHMTSINCVEYSVQLSGDIQDNSPPWTAEFSSGSPPPQSQPKDKDLGNPWCNPQEDLAISENDRNIAIDRFCSAMDGKHVDEYRSPNANLFDVPFRGEPQFWPGQGAAKIGKHLSFIAESTALGGDHAMRDKNWCLNWNFNLVKDDCRYAFRRITSHCYARNSGDFTYRCARYEVQLKDSFPEGYQKLELNPNHNCNEEKNYPGHYPIDPKTQGELANHWCNKQDGDLRQGDMYRQGIEVQFTWTDIPYYFMAGWASGCTTSVDRQNVKQPLGSGGPSCTDLMKNAFTNCNNGGVGGKVQAGCVQYEFSAGRFLASD